MFEQRREDLLSRSAFLWRMGRSFGITLLVVGFSLAIGSAGYHYFEDIGWVDSMLNAAMILTGMGPVDQMQTTGGKLFATFYALYSGIAFLTIMAIMLAPMMHRWLHHFHLEDDDDDDRVEATPPSARPGS
ncbi:MAG: hypothetical protein U0929_11570 [Planctomycetaceae bacterium]